ncbi:MAG: class I SAM-dependent methyltransferase [Proteobacteria bacterium]|nr:class I SAM-dependent methyltransferase [Pseudomonadota bacterium]
MPDRGESTGQPAASAREAEMFANRLRKRARHLRKWARREQITCYRLYDRDIPEIPLVVDRYQDHLHISSYRRDSDRDRAAATEWLAAMADAAARALAVPQTNIHVKQRARQRGAWQYGRLDHTDQYIAVDEGGHRFLVNLRDYVDTGLFLDQRNLRARIGSEARGCRFLNLFCYTGSFTVYAAAGGARATVSVDLSQRYLSWARRNLTMNRLSGPAHRFVRADIVDLLRCSRFPDRDEAPFDLVLLDPPTFSNSKKMNAVLDTKRDHAQLIAGALRLMGPGGVLYFATNARGFQLDVGAVTAHSIEDLGDSTRPPDFARRPPHRCFRIVK